MCSVGFVRAAGTVDMYIIVVSCSIIMSLVVGKLTDNKKYAHVNKQEINAWNGSLEPHPN